MSLADSMIARVAPAYDLIHADAWTILSPGLLSGITFLGDAQSEAAVEISSDLGADAREKVFLYLNRPAPALQRGMRISGKGATWVFVGDLDDNPANDRVRFEITKLVDGKDA